MVWEKVWLEVAWVSDRMGGVKVQKQLWGVKTHMEATGGYVKEGWGKGW